MSGKLAHLDRGCYEAVRAAALSGVPLRTVYYWAEHGIVVPSISPVREKLWSYGDLLTLRLVDWLRQPKSVAEVGLDLLAPYGARGPDLRQPRPHLRIVPGKVAGEPHLQHSRMTTRTIGALAQRFTFEQIAAMYPDEDPTGLREAIDLERQLAA